MFFLAENLLVWKQNKTLKHTVNVHIEKKNREEENGFEVSDHRRFGMDWRNECMETRLLDRFTSPSNKPPPGFLLALAAPKPLCSVLCSVAVSQ